MNNVVWIDGRECHLDAQNYMENSLSSLKVYVNSYNLIFMFIIYHFEVARMKF